MPGTKVGAKKTAITNMQRHGDDFYKKIAVMGGRVCAPYKGFGDMRKGKDGLTGPERARKVGTKGGFVRGYRWSATHRKKFERTIEDKKVIGVDVDLSQKNLSQNDRIWYKAP